jgi:hypothetical protein
MLDIYGLAAAHLSELKRVEDEARARYARGLSTEAAPRPGVFNRLAALFRHVSRNRAVRSAGTAEDRVSASCGGHLVPTRVAA